MPKLIEFTKPLLGRNLFEIMRETCKESGFGLTPASPLYYHHCPREWLAHKDYSEKELSEYGIYHLDLSLGIEFSAIVDNQLQENITIKSLIGVMNYHEAGVHNMPKLHQNDYCRFMKKFNELLKNNN